MIRNILLERLIMYILCLLVIGRKKQKKYIMSARTYLNA